MMVRLRWRNIGRSTRRCTSPGSRFGRARFGTKRAACWSISVTGDLADMDANGIELAILGLNSPGLQAILDSAEAANVARRANDLLAGKKSREIPADSPRSLGCQCRIPRRQRWNSPAA